MAKVTQAHVEARTQDILDAAAGLFARKGIATTTMQEIADEAGISAGAIYRYYPSKDDLLRAAFAGCIQENQALFDKAVASTQTPLQALLDVGRSVWASMKEPHKAETTMLQLEATLAAARSADDVWDEPRQVHGAIISMIERLVRDAQAAGEVHADVDARSLAIVLLACSIGTAVISLELKSELDPDAVFEVVDKQLMVKLSQPTPNAPESISG